MNPSRVPVPWVSQVLYGSVLVAGLYAELAGLGDTNLPVFLGGFAALVAVEAWGSRAGVGRVGVFAVRAGLLVVLAVADGAGLARVLLVLIAFHAYFVFGRRASIWVGAACLGAVVAASAWSGPGLASDVERLGDLLMFALGVALAIAMAAAAVDEQRYRARIAQLSAAEERNRLARDIHDDLGHHLTAIVVLLEKATAFRDRDPPVAQSALDSAARSARQALADVRRSVSSLRSHDTLRSHEPLRGHDLDLPRAASAARRLVHRDGLPSAASATRRLVDGNGVPSDGGGDGQVRDDGGGDGGGSFSVVSALRGLVHDDVKMEVAGDEMCLPIEAREVLYRAAQEGITNARRHAHATRIGVALHFHPHQTVLRVTDDGRGYVAGNDGFGLRGMRERVHGVGGEVTIESRSGGGTQLVVTVPRRGVR